MYKQVIIARKDLPMSPGKLAAQVSHASMAFLTHEIRRSAYDEGDRVLATVNMSKDLFEMWINGVFTKCVLGAKNKKDIAKAIKLADELGMEENVDYFVIRDICRTELAPEDEDGRTVTCVGFAPMESELIDKIGKKFQLY